MAQVQDLIGRDAFLAIQNQAIPRFSNLLGLGALIPEHLKLGVQPLAGKLTVALILFDVRLHVSLAGAAIRLTPLFAALVIAVQMALHVVVPFKDEAVVAVTYGKGWQVLQLLESVFE